MTEPDRYRLLVAPPARRALAAGLTEAVATAVWELVNGALLDNPHRIGKPLRDAYAGQWVARRSTYRVFYLIDDKAKTVTVLAIRGRADAYRT